MLPNNNQQITMQLVKMLHSDRDLRLALFGGIDPLINIEQLPNQKLSLIKSTIFAITSLSTNDVVGAIQLEYNETNRTYISYFLETQFRGLGIAEKAMRQALILHIKVSESNVIWAKCLRTNNKSIQLLERLGFIFQRLIASSLHYNEILEYKMVNCNEGSNDNPINVKLFPLSIDLLNVHFLGSDSSISIEPTK